MKAIIKIDCDTIEELMAHLHMLQVQAQDAAKKFNLNPATDEFHNGASEDLADDNCYGFHSVEFIPED